MSLYQNTRRPDGSRFETDTPMSRTEKIAWCAFYAAITITGIWLCIHFAGETR